MGLFNELESDGEVNVSGKVKQFSKRKIQLFKQIEKYLEEEGWEVEDLAKEMEISVDELKRKLENPEMRDLAKIEAAFGRSLFTVKRNLGHYLKSKAVGLEKVE